MVGPIEFHLPSVTSTNDYARELLHTYPYVFVSAAHQTSGRGRKGRIWQGDHGANIYCSFGMTHADLLGTEELASYMARGALASLHILRSSAPNVEFRVKYPNDVQALVGTTWSKISGVLVEHEFQGSRCTASIIGIGINVEQEHFPETIEQASTSLRRVGAGVAIMTVLEGLKQEFKTMRQRPWQDVHDEWVKELKIIGRSVSIVGELGKWNVQRILTDGRLVVRQDVTQQERIISDGDSVRYHDNNEQR